MHSSQRPLELVSPGISALPILRVKHEFVVSFLRQKQRRPTLCVLKVAVNRYRTAAVERRLETTSHEKSFLLNVDKRRHIILRQLDFHSRRMTYKSQRFMQLFNCQDELILVVGFDSRNGYCRHIEILGAKPRLCLNDHNNGTPIRSIDHQQ